MRLTRIQLNGYSRFREASCDVDGPIVAFVGPNEAGKSTLLKALDWLTDRRGKSIPPSVRNRESPPEDYDVAVRAVFVLDPVDLAMVRGLGLSTEEDLERWNSVNLIAERQADGAGRYVLSPPLHRDLTSVRDAAAVVAREIDSAEGIDERYVVLLDEIAKVLDDSDVSWAEKRVARLQSRLTELEGFIDEVVSETSEGEGEPAGWMLMRVRDALAPALATVLVREPDEVAIEALEYVVPQFVLFRESHRDLPASFNTVSNDGQVPISLSNLLSIGNTSVELIATAVAKGASARLTAMREINAALSVIAEFWSQNRSDGEPLRPHISINESGVIDIGVEDVEGIIAINERSDGLQTYLALIAFLLSTEDRDSPKILLIDEAERNLHYDAQGDLVRLLTNDLPVAQVLYTTHSPGCLPLDLGTGIRVVARSSSNPKESVLTDRFWTDQQPGFSRLLMMMGAEAAAFSALNSAVLTEGPSEMILLPRLLRESDATRVIDFQISFGLSNMSIPRDIGEVAIKTAFLVDGDAEGDRKIKRLLKQGVPERNLLQLRSGEAIEDLLDREIYLDAVDQVIREAPGDSILVERSRLAQGVTIAKAVEMLEKQIPGFRAPSHRHVALRLATRPAGPLLSPEGSEFVRTVLWPAFDVAFSTTYSLASGE